MWAIHPARSLICKPLRFCALLLGIIACQPETNANPGTQLDPDGAEVETARNNNGLNIFSTVNARSPAGLLYPPSPVPGAWQTSESGWIYRGFSEAGWLGSDGDTNVAAFQQYADLDSGAILNGFDFRMIQPATGRFLQVGGNSVGRDDEYLQFRIGQPGQSDFTLQRKQIPHTLFNNARILFDGAGSDKLTLPASVQPGLSGADVVRDYLLQQPQSQLAVQRDRTGISLSYALNQQWQARAGFSSELREGVRPYGGAFSYPGFGQVVETVEAVDQRTTEFSLGLRYGGDRLQGNVVYESSYFRNANESLTFANPGIPAIPGVYYPSQGQFATAPDNDFHSLRGDLATRFAHWTGHLSATVAYSTSRQNERLLAPTSVTGIGGSALYPVDFDQWNTTRALSQSRADVALDVLTFQLRYRIRPLPKLGMGFELNVRDEDNDNDYLAFNPLTDEYGYPGLDGALDVVTLGYGGIFRPSLAGNRVRIRAMPVSTDRIYGDITADYRLSTANKVSLRLRHQQKDYRNRERDRVTDNEIEMGLQNSSFDKASVRLSYEILDRSGDTYNPNPYEPFYSSSLPNFQPLFSDGPQPHTLSAMRKYDIADKRSQSLEARMHLLVSSRSDLQLSWKFSDENYDSDYGLRETQSIAANAEWNYQFNKASNAYVFYSFQQHERDVANINDFGRISSDGNPGGPVYPLDAAWRQQADETNHAAGAGMQSSFGRYTLSLDYTYTRANSELSYDYASTRAFYNTFSAEEAGNAFPQQRFTNHTLLADLSWMLGEHLSMRLFYRYERETLDDFHYRDLVDPVLNGAVYLLAVPENYSANLYGLSFKFTL